MPYFTRRRSLKGRPAAPPWQRIFAPRRSTTVLAVDSCGPFHGHQLRKPNLIAGWRIRFSESCCTTTRGNSSRPRPGLGVAFQNSHTHTHTSASLQLVVRLLARRLRGSFPSTPCKNQRLKSSNHQSKPPLKGVPAVLDWWSVDGCPANTPLCAKGRSCVCVIFGT